MMRYKHPSRYSTQHSGAGFTLVEMITVIVLVGILAAIAAPGWLGFINSRRADAGKDQVLQILRVARADATRTRQGRIVEFNTAATPPTITYRTEGAPANQAMVYQLGQEEGIDPNYLGLQIPSGMGVNNICTNCIAFDDQGTIRNTVTETQPLIITVLAPRNTPSARRCVVVRTLLGAIQTASGNTCQ